MDAFETIIANSQFAVCIVDNPSGLEVIDFPVPDDRIRDLNTRRAEFVGVIGLVCGVPNFALAVPLHPSDVQALSRDFVRHLDTAVNAGPQLPRPKGAEWLEALYALEDPRPKMGRA